MDEELERARRAVHENLEDVAAAIRFAAALERANRFVEAWTALVRLIGRSEDDAALLRALGELAARHPRATVQYLRQIEVGRARFSLRALAKAGELLPLVVLSLDEPLTVRQRTAQVCLRGAVDGMIDGLPGVQPLSAFVQSDDLRQWVPTIIATSEALHDSSREEVFRELGFTGGPLPPEVEIVESSLPRDPFGGADPFGPDPFGGDPFGGDPFDPVEDPFGQIPSRPPEPPAPLPGAAAFAAANPFGMGVLSGLLGGLPRRDHRGWLEFARALLARVRAERRVVLAPWVYACTYATDEALVAEARSAFFELTGQRETPLDADVLAARWPR